MTFVSETEKISETVNENIDFTQISELLNEMDLSRIEMVLNKHLNYAEQHKWEFPPILLFKLLIVKAFHKLSYRRLVSSLMKDDCEFLGIIKIEPVIFFIHLPVPFMILVTTFYPIV